MNYEYIEVHNFFKKELETIFLELKKVTQQTNLKLYDIAYTLKSENDYNFFNSFCESEFHFFEDFLKENDCEIESIGSTSSFYIASKGNLNFYKNQLNNYYIENDFDSFIDELSSLTDIPQSFQYETVECFLKNTELDDIENELLFLERNKEFMLLDFKNELSNIRKCYFYIEDFKKNQLEYFENSKL